MLSYRVTIVNEHFSQDAEQEAPDVTRAWQKALQSAISIAAEQVSHGNSFFGAVVTLEEGAGDFDTNYLHLRDSEPALD